MLNKHRHSNHLGESGEGFAKGIKGTDPMNSEGFKRKLTAILSADVKGYSRLMGEDEEATVTTLTAYRGVMATLIRKHRGRVVDSPGDNLLAEFASVVDAVRCAVEIQEELRARNSELPEGRKMEFRIGINLGDVIEEGARIYGDGVNIAARVEGLAEGGGICVSGTVYDQVRNKLALAYYLKGRYADSVRVSKQGLTRNPNFAEPYIPLAAAYAQLGRSEEAASAAAMIFVKSLPPFRC